MVHWQRFDFGTLSRNRFYGPGFQSLDASLFKTTRLTEKIREGGEEERDFLASFIVSARSHCM